MPVLGCGLSSPSCSAGRPFGARCHPCVAVMLGQASQGRGAKGAGSGSCRSGLGVTRAGPRWWSGRHRWWSRWTQPGKTLGVQGSLRRGWAWRGEAQWGAEGCGLGPLPSLVSRHLECAPAALSSGACFFPCPYCPVGLTPESGR